MTLEELNTEFRRFQDLGGLIRSTLVESPDYITEVQQSLGLEFSFEYTVFYQHYHRIRVGRNEFLAVNFLAEQYLEQVASKLLPAHHLFPILDDPTGGHYYLVCGHPKHRGDSERGRVLHYPTLARPDEVDESHESFFAFVVERIRIAEEYLDD